jgi:hypothetical protein
MAAQNKGKVRPAGVGEEVEFTLCSFARAAKTDGVARTRTRARSASSSSRRRAKVGLPWAAETPSERRTAEYAQVVKMLGNGRLIAQCFDGEQRLAHIRGKMRKKAG